MKAEKNKGIGWQQISFMVSIILAVFLSYIGMNHNLNQRIDRVLARVNAMNREMGEMKTEMRLRFDGMNREISEMKTEMRLRFDRLEKGK